MIALYALPNAFWGVERSVQSAKQSAAVMLPATRQMVLIFTTSK
jgi:hypothetical protein